MVVTNSYFPGVCVVCFYKITKVTSSSYVGSMFFVFFISKVFVFKELYKKIK